MVTMMFFGKGGVPLGLRHLSESDFFTFSFQVSENFGSTNFM